MTQNAGSRDSLSDQSRVHIDDPLAALKIADSLFLRLRSLDPGQLRPLVVVCIGTDRSTGDSLGPLVGTRLSRLRVPGLCRVLGTLDHPVHASNLKMTLESLAVDFSSPLVLAVDACLGQLESVGSITISAGSLRPGAGVNKVLPPVGDLHVSGIVNVGGYLEFMVLQNTRLNLVMRMAEHISRGISLGVKKYSASQPCPPIPFPCELNPSTV